MKPGLTLHLTARYPSSKRQSCSSSTHEAALVTGSVREFDRINGLMVEYWEKVELHIFAPIVDS